MANFVSIVRKSISPSQKKQLFAKSGNLCAFPGCDTPLLTEDGILIGQMCHIEGIAPGGPRYNPETPDHQLMSIDNLILLCPNHHQTIDSQPSIYTSEWLKRARYNHGLAINKALADSLLKKIDINKINTFSLSEALNVWQNNEDNANEEFWQKFFDQNPRMIAQAIPNNVVKLGQKCYVGGKSIDNQGGNVIDFLYLTRSHKNVVLVEIKTPMTKLIGSRYRTNAYSLSEELSGAIIQALNYRDELLKNYYSLCTQESSLQFSAFNPQCLVVAGNLNIENLDTVQRKSFELFRSNSNTVTIITFDELFGKVSDLIDLLA